MTKKITVLSSLLIASLLAFGQADTTSSASPWSKGATIAIQFTQTSFYQWSAGGQNSYAYAGLGDLFANYKKDKITWKNSLLMNYGLIKQGKSPLIKSDDRFELNSILGIQADKKWNYAIQYNYRTQFAPGYSVDAVSRTRISDFLAPAYMTFSVGVEYAPKEGLSWLISPITSKMTFVMAPTLSAAGAYGVDPGKNIRSEFGGLTRVSWKQELLKNVDINTDLTLFSNYAENAQNIDVNWNLMLVFRVNEYINFNFTTVLIYDDDILVPKDNNDDGIFESQGKGIQFKEIFALGFAYSIKK